MHISVFNAPDFSFVTRVSESGDIPFSILGKIHVAGLNSASAASMLASQLKDRNLMLDPQVMVTVETFEHRDHRLPGEVHSPGYLPAAPGKHQLSDLLAVAGGLNANTGRTTRDYPWSRSGQERVCVLGPDDPWFRERHPIKHVLKSVYWQIGEGRVLSDADGVLFTSEEECDRARGVFYGRPYKECVVRYGIQGPPSEEQLQRREFASAFSNLQDKRFLLYLGRIHPKKGCELLLQGFAQASKDIDPEIQLAIAGPGPSSYIAELKRLAYELQISDRIHWLGMLRGDRKWGALRSADAFILPSHQENFGIAVAEAMACSTPVLISDKVNIWREIDASKGGLVQPDTADGARNLIRKFYRRCAEERILIGTAAREGFLRNFELEASALDFARIIGFTPSLVLGKSGNKKILQVIHSTDPESGGPIEAVRRISEALINRGHQVEVACLETNEEASSRSFPFPVVGLGPGKGKFGYNPDLTKWIRKNAKHFDAVVLHGLWNYSSVGAWLGLRRESTPYFIYSHGMLDYYFRDRYPIKHIAKQLYWWFAEGQVLRDAAAVLFTCEEERIRARNVFRGYSYRERVVRFGTIGPEGDGERQKRTFRSALPALEDRAFLLFLSRIHPKKGCDLLIRAFAGSWGLYSSQP